MNRSRVIQDSCERVNRYQFVSSEAIITFGAHQRLSKATYKKYLSFLGLSTKVDCGIDDGFGVRSEPVAFRKLMHEDSKQKTAEFWYAT